MFGFRLYRMRFGDFKLKVTAKSQLTRTLINTLASNNKNQTRAAFVLNLHILLSSTSFSFFFLPLTFIRLAYAQKIPKKSKIFSFASIFRRYINAPIKLIIILFFFHMGLRVCDLGLHKMNDTINWCRTATGRGTGENNELIKIKSEKKEVMIALTLRDGPLGWCTEHRCQRILIARVAKAAILICHGRWILISSQTASQHQ